MNKRSDTIHIIILAVLPLLCHIAFRLLKISDEFDVRAIMMLSLFGLGFYAAYKQYKKELSSEAVIKLIIAAGCILRVGYMLYTHAFTRAYDVGMNNAEGVGHWGYFYQIINGHLPPSNEYQFYQPPLYYMIGGALVKIVMAFGGMTEWNGLEYIPQLVSCSCSIIVMPVTVRIMNELNIKKPLQIIPAALLAAYPAQVMAAGRINNDAMVEMFLVLALYSTLLWHKDRSMKNIIFIALSIGLGMMTKINCALAAFVAGPIMIYHFVKAIKAKNNKEIKRLVLQFAVFAVICFPLGLWYGIRNLIAFGQPLTYVHELPRGTILDRYNTPWFDRWIKFPLFSLKETPYINWQKDLNVWMLMLKTGIFEEFEWESISKLFACVFDYVHIALLLVTLCSVIFSLVKDKKLDKTQKYAALWVWLLVVLSYIQFNNTYRYSSTSDFRYLFAAQIAGSFFVAYTYGYLFENRSEKKCRIITAVYTAVIAVFCSMSIIFFC